MANCIDLVSSDSVPMYATVRSFLLLAVLRQHSQGLHFPVSSATHSVCNTGENVFGLNKRWVKFRRQAWHTFLRIFFYTGGFGLLILIRGNATTPLPWNDWLASIVESCWELQSSRLVGNHASYFANKTHCFLSLSLSLSLSLMFCVTLNLTCWFGLKSVKSMNEAGASSVSKCGKAQGKFAAVYSDIL